MPSASKSELRIAHNLALREYYRRDFPTFAKECLWIETKVAGKIEHLDIAKKPLQAMFWQQARKQIKEVGYIDGDIIKGRQQGSSTVSQGGIFWKAALTRNYNTLLIAQDDPTTRAIFEKARFFYEHLPQWLKPAIRKSNRQELVFAVAEGKKHVTDHGLGSTMSFQAATNMLAGTGTTRQGLHLCLRGDTEILLESGDTLPIADIKVGARVLTHRGGYAAITAKYARPALEVSGGDALTVRTWLNCERLTLTPEHKVWTRGGWRAAWQLRVNDELGTAIPTAAETKSIDITGEQRRKGPRLLRGEQVLNREFGFFCGYYLAEGSLGSSSAKRRHSIQLAAHETETAYGDRARAAVSSWIKSSTQTVRPGTHTLITILYGATALAETLERHFGHKNEKRIPSWVFGAPKEFREGLILGYCAGDGSKGMGTQPYYENPGISVTSARKRLVTNLRLLLASVNWGYGGLHKKRGGIDKRGWKSQDAWSLYISGLAADRIRTELGLPTIVDHSADERRRWTQKYEIDQGYVWLKIRSIEAAEADTVYDITVDDETHSFTTICGAVANSECAKYRGEDIDTLVSSVYPVLYRGPGSIRLKESTAFIGGGWFKEVCEEARDGRTQEFLLFCPAYLEPDNRYPLNPKDPNDKDLARMVGLDAEEKYIVRTAKRGYDAKDPNGKKYGLKPFDVPPEFLKFRRVTIAQPGWDEELWMQEYPAQFDQAWISRDARVFNHQKLYEIQRKYVQQPKRLCTWEDSIHKFVDDDKVRMGPQENYVAIWEDPILGHDYDIGADVAGGIDGGDYSTAVVWERRSRRQVAEVHLHIDPSDYGTLLFFLGQWYFNAQIAVEWTGGYGISTDTQLKRLNYPNISFWKHRDQVVPMPTKKTGWETTQTSKAYLVSYFRHFVNHDNVIIRSLCLLNEMFHFIQIPYGNGYEYRAESGNDDLVMGAGIGLVVSDDENLGRVDEIEPEPKSIVVPPPYMVDNFDFTDKLPNSLIDEIRGGF